MIYFLSMVVICLNLYAVKSLQINFFIKKLFFWMPAFLAFFIPMALQDNVGTDYLEYKSMYGATELELYNSKGEFFISYVINLSHYLGDSQFIFAIFSLCISLIFFYSIFLLEKKGFEAWLLVFLYLTCTGLYQTSFNILRQSVVIAAFPILFILVVEKKYFKFLFMTYFFSFVHKTSLLYFLILITQIFKPKKKTLFFIFLTTLFFYLLVNQKQLIMYIFSFPFVVSLSGNYSYYLDSEFFEAGGISSILTKIYYIPLYFIFWYYYLKDKNINNFLDSVVFIWSLTYFMFLQMIYISIYYRIWYVFSFLMVFPLYYVLKVVYKKNIYVFFMIILYILIPFFIKVVVFPTAEYSYNFHNFIF